MKLHQTAMLSLALFSLSSVSFGQTQAKQLITSKSTLPMPIGFTDIYLGMDIHYFVKIHPHAKPFTLSDKPKPIDLTSPNQPLIEGNIENSLFSSAFFFFRDSKIDMIGLASSRVVISNKDVEKFVVNMIVLYGQPDEYAVIEYQHGKQVFSSPGIYWHCNSAVIGANIPPLDVNGQITPGFVGLEIGLSSEYKSEKLFAHRHLKKADEEKVLAPARALIAQLSKKPKA